MQVPIYGELGVTYVRWLVRAWVIEKILNKNTAFTSTLPQREYNQSKID